MLQFRIRAQIVIYCYFFLLVSAIIRIYPLIDLFETNINILFNFIRGKVIVSSSAINLRKIDKPKCKIKAKLFGRVPLTTRKFVSLRSCCLLSVFPIYQCNEFRSSVNQDNHIDEQATDSTRTCIVALSAISNRKCH